MDKNVKSRDGCADAPHELSNSSRDPNLHHASPSSLTQLQQQFSMSPRGLHREQSTAAASSIGSISRASSRFSPRGSKGGRPNGRLAHLMTPGALDHIFEARDKGDALCNSRSSLDINFPLNFLPVIAVAASVSRHIFNFAFGGLGFRV
jgi:hypothetical protein